jgi:hypothetical protein
MSPARKQQHPVTTAQLERVARFMARPCWPNCPQCARWLAEQLADADSFLSRVRRELDGRAGAERRSAA